MILVLFLSGCARERATLDIGDIKNGDTSDLHMQEPDFIEIEWLGIDWNLIEFPLDPKEIKIPADVSSIATKEDAIKVGGAIIENFWENGKFPDYVLLAIVHSTKENLWYQ